jgi:hypothetical protein
MPNCAVCGRFIPQSEIIKYGGARFEYTPDSEFTSERCEWTCKKCADTGRKL